MHVTKPQLLNIISKLPMPERCKYCVLNYELTGKGCSIWDTCESGIGDFLSLDKSSFERALEKLKTINKERKNEEICR